MTIARICFLATLVFFGALSCSDEKGTTGPDPTTPFPYTAPSSSSMRIDTSDLADGQPILTRGLCHGVSALIVYWIDANIVFRLAVPIGAFIGCLLRTPVYLGDDTWRWTAQGGTGTDAHTDELTAHVVGEGVIDWSMRVSGTRQQLNRFLWFDGRSDTTASHGEWHFYDPNSPATPYELIRIDWTVDGIPGAATDLEIECVDPQSSYFGDRLNQSVRGTMASLVLVDQQADSSRTTTISWDMVTGTGMAVTAAGDSCCWGERPDYVDVTCP